MKKQIRRITLLAVFAILAIVGYQTYWLADIYTTLQANLNRDIKEAMRASDFEEIVHRVEQLKNEQQGGQMSVRVGINDEHDKAVVANNYDERPIEEQEEAPSQVDNPLQFDEFANVLRTEDDVINVGLQMQRGIHQGLDLLKPIDVHYYDSLLQRRLDSLGVNGHNVSLHLCYDAADSLHTQPTVAFRSNDANYAHVDTFRFVINAEGSKEYLLLREKSLFTLPHQMYSPILLSLLTLLLIVVALWYIIRMIKRMYQLDEMKTDFTNNVTHEMKTPIAVAYAAGDALLNFDAGRDPLKQKKYLTICLEQLDLLKELVERILSLSTERQMKMKLNIETVNVNKVVSTLATNHRLKTKKNVTIETEIPTDLTLQTDPFHFTNIMNNLLDNAIKYSGDPVTIQISSRTTSRGTTLISIKDNGMGIASDQQKFVFDRFYRVPHGNVHDIKGYGLGLNYVKVMMERFGGSVSLTSELGKGSAFTLHFPT